MQHLQTAFFHNFYLVSDDASKNISGKVTSKTTVVMKSRWNKFWVRFNRLEHLQEQQLSIKKHFTWIPKIL